MSRDVKTNEVVLDQFPVWDWDGYTKVSGETSFAVTLWKDTVVSAIPVTVAEIGVSGEYQISFTPDSVGYWRVEVIVDYNKDAFGFEYTVSDGVTQDIYEGIRRILGLNHENIFIDNTTYDTNSQLVSSRVRLFDSKVTCNAATDGGSETDGLIATYFMTTTWDALNEFGFFRQIRED